MSFFCVAAASVAAAANAARPPEDDCKRGSARFEIAPWLALGTGVRREHDGHQRGLGTVAADVAVTVPIIDNLRLGAWASPGTVNFSSFDVATGARIELQTNEFASQHSDLFMVGGRYSLIIDAGVGKRFGPSNNQGEFFVARVAFGFTAPNRLYGPYVRLEDCRCNREQQVESVCRHPYGIVAGVRPFVALHRAFNGSRTEITGGLEFEVVGAGWWLGGG